MTNQKLIELEKEIESKIRIPEQKKSSHKFVVDVKKLKELAARLNEYESKSNAATQQ